MVTFPNCNHVFLTYKKARKMKSKLIPFFVMLAISQNTYALQPPSAGSQLQQIPTLPLPTPQEMMPEIKIESGQPPATPTTDNVKIQVNTLNIIGMHVFKEADLIAVSGFKSGQEYTLTDLRAMAAKIADYYHHQGYFVAQAYLAAQDIKDNTVSISVLEGQYGKIKLNNQSTMKDSLLNRQLDRIHSGDTIAIDPLENRLLMLSDLPGVHVTSTLVPGEAVGTSDLLVDVTPAQFITGSVFADNYGNRYTGEYRVGGNVNFNNITGHADVLSFTGFTAIDGLYYGRAGYETQIGDGRVGIAYSRLQYRLLREFKDLKAHGDAEDYSIYGIYPLIRTRNNNLYAHLGFDFKDFQDKIDSTSSITDKEIYVGTASLIGDHRDNWGGGGFDAYALSWIHGNLNIQTPAARALDSMTARSNGSYDKLAFNASRLQNLTDVFSIYGRIQGQIASKNLDISEKMELGGAYGVRAYPEGEAFADEGYLVNLEARALLPKWSDRIPGRMQLVAFVDTGSVTINHHAYGPGDNHRTLSGAGVGFDWGDTNNFLVRVSYAFKLGHEKAISAPDESGRLWVQLVKYF